jgi:RimJ/RimL family protein N-acetyltransferase
MKNPDKYKKNKALYLCDLKDIQPHWFVCLNLGNIKNEVWYKLHFDHWGKGYGTEKWSSDQLE